MQDPSHTVLPVQIVSKIGHFAAKRSLQWVIGWPKHCAWQSSRAGLSMLPGPAPRPFNPHTYSDAPPHHQEHNREAPEAEAHQKAVQLDVVRGFQGSRRRPQAVLSCILTQRSGNLVCGVQMVGALGVGAKNGTQRGWYPARSAPHSGRIWPAALAPQWRCGTLITAGRLPFGNFPIESYPDNSRDMSPNQFRSAMSSYLTQAQRGCGVLNLMHKVLA